MLLKGFSIFFLNDIILIKRKLIKKSFTYLRLIVLERKLENLFPTLLHYFREELLLWCGDLYISIHNVYLFIINVRILPPFFCAFFILKIYDLICLMDVT